MSLTSIVTGTLIPLAFSAFLAMPAHAQSSRARPPIQAGLRKLP
jgi:hypothetical protein